MEILGYAPWGYDGALISIEVDIRRGIPGMEIIGLPGNVVREARERIRIALRSAGFQFPNDRIIINLSPADLPKNGAGFDLPMALALLAASGQWIPKACKVMAIGELALDGRLRSVPGLLSALVCGQASGVDLVIVPEEGLTEVLLPVTSRLISSPHLRDLLDQLGGGNPRIISSAENRRLVTHLSPKIELRGQAAVVHGLTLAAAGGHSMLLYGPPGSGKTLAAQALEQLLPDLDSQEALETSRIWSLAGRFPMTPGLMQRRPFCSPHHQASAEGILGGGKELTPGEISLAHHGVLLLDEAPEFSPRVLQALREPLEQGEVRVVRAGRMARFPARFQLILTANACRCGQRGKPDGVCLCSPLEVRRYWDRLGNALLDRIDLRFFVTPIDPHRLLTEPTPAWGQIRQTIQRARDRQSSRNPAGSGLNALLPPEALTQLCALNAGQNRLLAEICRQEGWSSRGLHSLLRIARTSADLADREVIEEADLLLAAQVRKPAGEAYWMT